MVGAGVVGPDGALPLPWLAGPLQDACRRQGHALLLHGPEGVGQFELALTVAQAGLCEASGPAAQGEPHAQRPGWPCGRCAACRLVQAGSHPDMLVLVPEASRQALGWGPPGEGEEGGTEKTSKGKPSREIKVDAVRAAVEFAQTTSSRGRGKVVVLHPAERVNAIAANTLLKTLEEPPGSARFVLSCARPEILLPTIRSRCQALRLEVPSVAEASAWLATRGLVQPAVLLAGCGGGPLQALQWAGDGIDATVWARFPALVVEGAAGGLQGWPVARVVDALQKLCHDAICVTSGRPARYFPDGTVTATTGLDVLTRWAQRLRRLAEQAEHPWSAGLAIDALVDDARRALVSGPLRPFGARVASIHSRP